MENQIKEETENTYRNYRKSRNSDEKLKKINDDLEPILATQSKLKLQRISVDYNDNKMKNFRSSKTSVGREDAQV